MIRSLSKLSYFESVDSFSMPYTVDKFAFKRVSIVEHFFGVFNSIVGTVEKKTFSYYNIFSFEFWIGEKFFVNIFASSRMI